ncbi:FGGY-family carbohydrate kinase [Microbacterium saperdae]
MVRLLLGIDAGLTVTKSVIFDEHGRHLGTSSRRVQSASPAPYHVERDQDELWRAVTETVREVVASTGIDPGAIASIGVTAHGDGIYLVDQNALPVAPGVLSLDTRARAIVDRWERDGTSDAALALSGQRPFASAPAALLAWFADQEPQTLAAASFALPCKDMIKARLTGIIATDRTEASLSFVDYRTQEYDRGLLDLYGIPEAWRLLAPVVDSTRIAGRITEQAAAALGLVAGTPVAAGAHDVDCSAIGSGAVAPDQFALIAGTYSINQAIASAPVVDGRWCARNFVIPGLWMHQAVSPSSATNMEWFVREICRTTGLEIPPSADPFEFVEREIAAIQDDSSDVIYLPFLYGSPLPADASGAFLGLRGWHQRGHLLRAVMEGVVYNHVWHVDDLLSSFTPTSIHLTGGATNSSRWCQMFADAIGRDVRVALAPEAGALGVCLLAGIAGGVFSDLEDAVRRAGGIQTVFRPDPATSAKHRRAFERYRAVVTKMGPVWETAHAV